MFANLDIYTYIVSRSCSSPAGLVYLELSNTGVHVVIELR